MGHALQPEVRDPATGHQAAGHQVAGRGRVAFLLAVRLEEERRAGQEAAAAAMLAADVAAASVHARGGVVREPAPAVPPCAPDSPWP
jgi:hypothetical protein